MKLWKAARKYGPRVVAGGSALLVSAVASATAIVDYSGAVTSATAEITASTATGVTLFGTVLAIGIGLRVMKKFGKG